MIYTKTLYSNEDFNAEIAVTDLDDFVIRLKAKHDILLLFVDEIVNLKANITSAFTSKKGRSYARQIAAGDFRIQKFSYSLPYELP